MRDTAEPVNVVFVAVGGYGASMVRSALKLRGQFDCRLAGAVDPYPEWKFVAVRDSELRQQLVEAARGQQFVGETPVVVAACAVETDHIMPCGHPSHLIDVATAIDHVTLASREPRARHVLDRCLRPAEGQGHPRHSRTGPGNRAAHVGLSHWLARHALWKGL